MLWPGGLLLSASVSLALACSDDGPPTDQSQPGIGVWDPRAPLLSARQEMPSALVNGRIYTPGGFDAQGATVATLEIYDVAADRWQRMQAARAAQAHARDVMRGDLALPRPL